MEFDDATRGRVDRRRAAGLVAACAKLTSTDGTSLGLRALARWWQYLEQEVRDSDKAIELLTRQTVPGLLAQPDIGPICAAQLLITAGDNPERLSGEAAFAALCGISPVEHSSGDGTPIVGPDDVAPCY